MEQSIDTERDQARAEILRLTTERDHAWRRAIEASARANAANDELDEWKERGANQPYRSRQTAPPGASTMEQAQELLRGLRAFNHHGNGAPERVARALEQAAREGFKSAIAKTSPGWEALQTALRMIRDAVEELAPVGGVPSRDVGPPDYLGDAEDIITGINAIRNLVEREARAAAAEDQIRASDDVISRAKAEARAAAFAEAAQWHEDQYVEIRDAQVKTPPVLAGAHMGTHYESVQHFHALEREAHIHQGQLEHPNKSWGIILRLLDEARAEIAHLRGDLVTEIEADRTAAFAAGVAGAVDNVLAILDEEGWLGQSKQRIRVLVNSGREGEEGK
jgi:hypothetical protein